MEKSIYKEWSNSQLINRIKQLERNKEYGLIWDQEKTKEVFEITVEKKLPILKNVIKNGMSNKSALNNILIEGDNYHALSILSYTHEEKIDVIYIDPPYNTGNGFRYNDKIVDRNDSYKHSKWLSFMNKRLRLARQLLTKNGVILISIDDQEQSQLKILCDEIFGEANFYAMLNWTARNKPMNAGSSRFKIQKSEEYVLVYGKISMQERVAFNLEIKEKLEYPNDDGKGEGEYRIEEVQQRKNIGIKRSEKMAYTILNIKPKEGYRWTIGHEHADEMISKKHLYVKNTKIVRKIFKSEESDVRFHPFWANLSDIYGSSESGKKELDEIIPNHGFETVKPTELIKKLIFHTTTSTSTILDFFAGSGTTGHAILELNNEDHGDRKFILCTNNENNICSNVCYPRLKKIITGYKNSKNKKILGLGGNLKYFKTAFVNSEPTDQNKKNMVEQSTEMLCLKENCFDLIESGKKFKIFKNYDGNYLGIVYYYDGIDPFKKEVLKLERKINTYVFSLTDEVDTEDFDDVAEWVYLKPIPSAILNVYRRIFSYVKTKRLSGKPHK